MDLQKDCGWPREEVAQPDETADTVSRLICETTQNRVVSHARGRVNDELGANATPGLGILMRSSGATVVLRRCSGLQPAWPIARCCVQRRAIAGTPSAMQ